MWRRCDWISETRTVFAEEEIWDGRFWKFIRRDDWKGKVEKWRCRAVLGGQDFDRQSFLACSRRRKRKVGPYVYVHTRNRRRWADIIQYNVGPSDIICSRAVSSARAPINLDSISTKRGFMFSAPLGLKSPAGTSFWRARFFSAMTPRFSLSLFSFPLQRNPRRQPRNLPRAPCTPTRCPLHHVPLRTLHGLAIFQGLGPLLKIDTSVDASRNLSRNY